MNLIAQIREKDVDPSREQLPDEAHINYREAAKVVLFDNENNIALIHYPNKPDYPGDSYYIPGGGVEAGETIEDALRRESLEETGCQIKDVEGVGYIEAYMKDGLLKQKAYLFTAKVSGGKGLPQMIEKEIEEGMSVVWKPFDEALTLVSHNSVKNFATVFALNVLNYIKKHKQIS